MALEVIGAGMGRTGTMSLKAALETLGFAPCDHYSVLGMKPALWPAWIELIEGRSKNWESVYGEYNAAVDCPAWFYYRELAEFYPDAKVVLTLRERDSWFASTQETVLSDWVFESWKQWPAELVKITRAATLAVAGDRRHDRDYVLDWFERHNAEVERTIPKSRLLVYEVAQGWGPLCRFLDVAVPDEPFPRLNDRESWLKFRPS